FIRDENKRFTEAAYFYSQVARREPDRVCLYIAGQFSPEVVQYNFDFFNGEQVEFLGPLTERKQVAAVMRTCKYLLFPAFADASPNTVGEAKIGRASCRERV